MQDSANTSSGHARKDIFGIVERKGSNFWTKIGVAFINQDGSMNLYFDFMPSRPEVRVQVRDPYEPRVESAMAKAS